MLKQVSMAVFLSNYNKQIIIIQTSMQPQFASRYAITFGQVGVLHIGSQQLGKIAECGFTVDELNKIQQLMITEYGIDAALINLTQKLPPEVRKGNEAAVLYLPGAVDAIMAEKGVSSKLYEEQESIKYDTKYFSAQYQKTLNKRARHNIVFSDFQREHSEDYKEFAVKDFKNLPLLSKFREIIGKLFGPKAERLNANGNKYFQQESGIGFHGDSERKIIVCLSLGRSSIVRYFWRVPKEHQNVFGPTDVHVNHGDIYIMSDKASGHDWRKTKLYRLVHAAGSAKFIGE